MATPPTSSSATAADWLLVREAAAIARVTPPTIVEWIHRGVLAAARVPGGYRIHRDALEALLGARTVGGEAAADYRAAPATRQLRPMA